VDEPFYWERRDGEWWIFTLHGMREVATAEPVVHLSYFEADAYARWAGARLPTEAEWESRRADGEPDEGQLRREPVRSIRARPAVRRDTPAADVRRRVGVDAEPVHAVSGLRPPPGALGEYNGKFMCNQFVLRGGSCATSRTHIRPTYRNFFPPDATWQFTGMRLARDP
jgi:formylglycine-generating enzyme required for sulfatase activity